MSAAEAAEARKKRGLMIAALCRITKKHDQWIVPSQTGNGAYRVNIDPKPFVPQCTCKDFEATGKPCKHVYAVQYVIERERNPDGSETITETITEETITKHTKAPKPTYKQNWPAYDAAQVNEKRKFQTLLFDLCRGIAEPPRKPGRGRKPIPLRDAVFSVVFKVYSTVSARRFMSDLEEAASKGYVAKAPHYAAISDILETPSLTPILKALIAESARPLKAVEEDFAVDSSGFTSSRFVRWFDHKYGQPKQEHDWVKVSVMTGVKTNIITAVEVDERYAGDCPRFKPLVDATAKRFKINEVSADSAYASHENMDAVAGYGGTPYIAYRANANPSRTPGGMYEKMFHYYSLRRDEFLSHYHKRSNVESTFSMVKAKFGDHVRSKTDTAMANEALAKVLCHNICVLIQSHYELRIVSKFWDEAEPSAEEAAQAKAKSIPAGLSPADLVEAFAWM